MISTQPTFLDLLAEAHVSPGEAAQDLKVTRAAVWLWVHGKAQPQGYNLVRLSRLLGKSEREIREAIQRSKDGGELAKEVGDHDGGEAAVREECGGDGADRHLDRLGQVGGRSGEDVAGGENSEAAVVEGE